MQEVLESALVGMGAAAIAAVVTFFVLDRTVVRLRKTLFTPKHSQFDDQYLNREYARPDTQPRNSAAA